MAEPISLLHANSSRYQLCSYFVSILIRSSACILLYRSYPIYLPPHAIRFFTSTLPVAADIALALLHQFLMTLTRTLSRSAHELAALIYRYLSRHIINFKPAS